MLADPQDFWLHFGDVQIGPENARWPVRAIENLVTGEQYPLDWNGRRLRRPRGGSLRCCSVVMLRRPDMNIVPTLDTETAQKFDDELWFKDVIIYQLHVKAFQDSNGDGVGDFVGLRVCPCFPRQQHISRDL